MSRHGPGAPGCRRDAGHRRHRAQLTVVGDIRLDDRSDLLASLSLESAGELSDPDLVLAAYRRWSDRCAEHLMGDFAFALWDDRRRQLLCAA